MKAILRQWWGRFLDRFVLRKVQEQLDELAAYYPERQLIYDVTKYVVFNQIEGDYLEFGVYIGSSLIQFIRGLENQWRSYTAHARQFGHEYDSHYLEAKRYFAFDSFKGLPLSHDLHRPKHFSLPGTYAATKEQFWENVKNQGVGFDKIKMVEGWFDETLSDEAKQKMGLRRAAAIFIDCDLYESAVPIFKFITSVIQQGTVLIMDDFFRYQGHPARGVQGAFREWKADHPEIQVDELTRCSANRIAFICHPRDASGK